METYQILEKILAIPSVKRGGWQKELNLVSWYAKEPVYDLREWNEDHSRMSKGITLTKDELAILKRKLQEVEL